MVAWLAGKAGSLSFYRAIQVGYTAARRVPRAAVLPPPAAPHRMRAPAGRAVERVLLRRPAADGRQLHHRSLHPQPARRRPGSTGHAGGVLPAAGLYRYPRSARAGGHGAGGAPRLPGQTEPRDLGGLYAGFVLLWDRNWKRAFAFSAATGALTAAVVGACYAIWGQPFFYWTFRVLGAHAISPLRSFQHVLDSWTYFAAGLLGGAVVLRAARRPRRLPARTPSWAPGSCGWASSPSKPIPAASPGC